MLTEHVPAPNPVAATQPSDQPDTEETGNGTAAAEQVSEPVVPVESPRKSADKKKKKTTAAQKPKKVTAEEREELDRQASEAAQRLASELEQAKNDAEAEAAAVEAAAAQKKLAKEQRRKQIEEAQREIAEAARKEKEDDLLQSLGQDDSAASPVKESAPSRAGGASDDATSLLDIKAAPTKKKSQAKVPTGWKLNKLLRKVTAEAEAQEMTYEDYIAEHYPELVGIDPGPKPEKQAPGAAAPEQVKAAAASGPVSEPKAAEATPREPAEKKGSKRPEKAKAPTKSTSKQVTNVEQRGESNDSAKKNPDEAEDNGTSPAETESEEVEVTKV